MKNVIDESISQTVETISQKQLPLLVIKFVSSEVKVGADCSVHIQWTRKEGLLKVHQVLWLPFFIFSVSCI